MKTYSKIFFAAIAAAFTLASCAREELASTESPQNNLVTVHFGAESQIATTKATLTTEDEKAFKSAWENGDVLSVEYENTISEPQVVDASWKSETSSFIAVLPEHTGIWEYRAVYPKPDDEGIVDFGSSRIQKGNMYNSGYDLMYGGATAENAAAGKTDDGKDIVFNMNRQTAIVYFHLTGSLDEEVVSATLKVNEPIASSLVMALDYKDGFDISEKDLNEITITFENGTAPNASDFSLWFNVLPTEYTSMTLTIETSGHTLTLSNTSVGTYAAGKLYKVVKEIPDEKWKEKTQEMGEETYTLIESTEDLCDGNYIICMALNSNVNDRQYLENGKKSRPSTLKFGEGISISDDRKSITVNTASVTNAKWSLASVNAGFSITSGADNSLGLGTTGDNDGLTTQTTYKGKPWSITYDSKDSRWILKYTVTNRYLNVYSLSNPRTYTSSTTNNKGKIYLYRLVDPARPSISVDKDSKTWASTETDAFVVKVSVNAEGGDWTVSPTTLDWATVVVDKTSGTITVTPNGENTSETAHEAKLTVSHASDATLAKTITLKQNAAGAVAEPKNGKVTFGKDNNMTIDKASVTWTDAAQTSWTVTTVGTSFFSNQTNSNGDNFSQIGSSNQAATSITLVGKNASAKKIESVSAKFGGYKGTAGTIAIKVGETQVGSGKLNATTDVTVNSTSPADGNTITISVTNISKGVKLYSIEYTYTE